MSAPMNLTVPDTGRFLAKARNFEEFVTAIRTIWLFRPRRI
jgi:hypothetical protein